jgi:hypothetical protein
LGANIQAIQEDFDRLEQVEERIVTDVSVLGCLVRIRCQNATHVEPKRGLHTASKTAIPANTAFEGENGYSRRKCQNHGASIGVFKCIIPNRWSRCGGRG